MGIYKKLLSIQKSVRGLTRDKDGHGYKYVSGDKILTHVRSMMDELGVILKPEILKLTNTRQDYTVSAYKYESGVKVDYQRPKSEILTTLNMRFTWICVETDTTDVALWASNGQNDWDKGTGSALTYAERYFLLKYFHIPTDEDDVDALPPKDSIPTDEDDKNVPKKPILSEKNFNAALSRINKGEKGLIVNLEATYTISVAQKTTLQSAENNYKPKT